MSNYKNLPPYGLNTTAAGKYNVFASNVSVDLAEQSENTLVQKYISQVRQKLMPQIKQEDDNGNSKTLPISEIALLEGTMEKLIINAEEKVTRTINNTADPNHVRSHTCDASECYDEDRVSTTKLNFTTSLNLQINNSMAINE